MKPPLGKEELSRITANRLKRLLATCMQAPKTPHLSEPISTKNLLAFIQMNVRRQHSHYLANTLHAEALGQSSEQRALAKAVEVCASKGQRWLMYGRIGNHPSLDRFKESNGFVKYPITRFYVPLTWKGRVAVRLGLHRELKDALPQG